MTMKDVWSRRRDIEAAFTAYAPNFTEEHLHVVARAMRHAFVSPDRNVCLRNILLDLRGPFPVDRVERALYGTGVDLPATPVAVTRKALLRRAHEALDAMSLTDLECAVGALERSPT